MPGGRGRGLRQNQSVAEIFNDPDVVAKQGGNPWDDPNYAWSKPEEGSEQLRNYLTSSDYWGYQGWDPLDQGGGRYISRGGDQDLLEYMGANPDFDPTKLPRNTRIQYPNRPEADIEYRLNMLFPQQGSNISPAERKYQVQKAKKQQNDILQRMREEYRQSTGEDYLGEFSMLDRLRYMEQKRINLPAGSVPYTGPGVWAGRYGTGGPGGGSTGGGGQEGGGKGGVGNRSLSPGAPGPPVNPRPQLTAPLSAGSQDRQQRYRQSRGPSRALGPRSPIRQSPGVGRSVAELFNDTGGFRPPRQRRNIWEGR